MTNYSDAAYQSEKAAIERRRKLIEALMVGSRRQEMAGNMVVPYSGVEAIGKVLSSYLGTVASDKLDTQTKTADEKYQGEMSQRLAGGLQAYDQARTPQAAQPPPFPNDDEGNPMPGLPAKAGDPRAAAMALIQSNHPLLQQMGAQEALAGNKQEAFTLKPGERRYQGNAVVAEAPQMPEVGKPSPEHFTPESVAKYAKSGNYADLVPVEQTIKVGTNRERMAGGNVVQEQWNGKSWEPYGQGPRFKPDSNGPEKPPAGYRWSGNQLEAIPGGPATPKPNEQYLKHQTGVANVQAAIGEYRDALKTMSPTDYVSPAARAKMGTVYNNMLLQAKEAYNLGVLNGPDYMILQQVITNPMSLRGLTTSKGALDEQASKLEELMSKIGKTSAQVHRQPEPDLTSHPALVPNADGSYNYVPRKRR